MPAKTAKKAENHVKEGPINVTVGKSGVSIRFVYVTDQSMNVRNSYKQFFVAVVIIQKRMHSFAISTKGYISLRVVSTITRN